mmetsp:Transcript_115274/g.229696  ORF Transcript_115274/g.229696 Transcript_115274/m.229696 type:complete len:383 (+) Transcript_115274:104-1252(+)
MVASRSRAVKLPGKQHDHAQLENAIWGLQSSFRALDRAGRCLDKGIARSRRRLLPQLLANEWKASASQRSHLLPVVDTEQWAAFMKEHQQAEAASLFAVGELEALVGSTGASREGSQKGNGGPLQGMVEHCSSSDSLSSGDTDYMLELIWNNDFMREMTDPCSCVAEELLGSPATLIDKCKLKSKEMKVGRGVPSKIERFERQVSTMRDLMSGGGSVSSLPATARRTSKNRTTTGTKLSKFSAEDLDGSSIETQHLALAPRFQVKVVANRPFSAPLMTRDNRSTRQAEAAATVMRRRPATARESSSHRARSSGLVNRPLSPTQISRPPKAFAGPRRPRSAFAACRASSSEAPVTTASFEPQSRWMPPGGLLDPKVSLTQGRR